jgi:hypothetical protein
VCVVAATVSLYANACRESNERAFAYGLWIAIGEVYCNCASDGLAIENLQKVPLDEDLLQ